MFSLVSLDEDSAILTLIKFIICLKFFIQLSHADVVYEKLDEKDYAGRQYVTVTINNSIQDGDYETLKDVLNEINQNNYRLKEDSIYLNSQGGLVEEAKLMGHIIRKNHHATKVNKEAYCNSACIFLLVSGSCRMAEGDVGMHRKEQMHISKM